MAKKKWITDAIKHPGALTRKAKKVGMLTMAYARKHDKGNSTTAKQSRLAETLSKFHK